MDLAQSLIDPASAREIPGFAQGGLYPPTEERLLSERLHLDWDFRILNAQLICA